jgi:thiol-disulfide isomerase/thioredoxin
MRLAALALALTLAPAARAAEADPKEAPRVLLAAHAGVGRFVPDVAFTDVAGKSGKLSDFKANKLTVVAFTNTTCPVSKKYAPALQKLEKEWAAKGVSFLFVNPTKTDKVESPGFAGRYVHDTDGTLTAAFGPTTTAEVFVLDAARTVQYRGAISDQYGLGYALDAPRSNYLTTALTDLLAGKQPVVPATTAPGCELSAKPATPRAAENVTYHARIERIIQNNCVECHRKGGVAPFALDTYDDVVANKGMIRKTVDKGTMPPWFAAAPKKGEHSPFANDRTLPDDDKRDLFAWLASADLKKGDPADAPLPRNFDSGWGIGKPDVVYELSQPQKIKAEGVMPYQLDRVPTDFAEDRWVQALEVQPTARDVTHHVLVFAVPKGRALGGEQSGFFAAYVPGNNNLIYPEGYAKKLPKGYDLVFQLHYTPNGKATTDRTKIALTFAKEKPRYEVHTFGIANPGLTIPANDGNAKVLASDTFDARILAFFPHAHLRGKAVKYELRDAAGKTRTLLDVPHYDFNWQLQYRFRDPVPVKMDEIVYTAWYDNSDKNPANPDPSKKVKWGPQTFDEMHLGYVEFVFDRESEGAWKFPEGGVAIPEQFKQNPGLKKFDTNDNGRFEPGEYEAMTPLVKRVVTQHFSRTIP